MGGFSEDMEDDWANTLGNSYGIDDGAPPVLVGLVLSYVDS